MDLLYTAADRRWLTTVVRLHHGCFDAKRSAAADPASDQRRRVTGHPSGCPRRAKRGGAPQGSSNIEERSDGDVYGATPSAAAKETITLPRYRWGGGRSRGSRSPSGESPKASSGATTQSVHRSMSVERGEA
jgi:hypothetical protein